MKNHTLIVGLGTGRCGTLTLTSFLNQQFGQPLITHEGDDTWYCGALGWDAPPNAKQIIRGVRQRWMGRIQRNPIPSNLGSYYDRRIAGDIALWHLPYADELLRIGDVKAVVVRRRRADTQRSFVTWFEDHLGLNPFSRRPQTCGKYAEPLGCALLSKCFPSLPNTSVYDGAGTYWDAYYAWTESLAAYHGPSRVAMFDMETLWDPTDVSERARLLRFVGQRKPWRLALPSSNGVYGHVPGWQKK